MITKDIQEVDRLLTDNISGERRGSKVGEKRRKKESVKGKLKSVKERVIS
jgi:hypothetical protein